MSSLPETENKEEKLLFPGILPHHEIEHFYMDEDKIEKECDPVTWSNCDATTYTVRRGPNYVPGQKAPSKKALYKVFAVDGYKVEKKIPNIIKYVNIDNILEKNKIPYDSKKFPLPPLIVINIMLPNYPPEYLSGKCDGDGYQLIFYAGISSQVREILESYSNNKISELPPPIKLLSDFIHADKDSPLRQRFKVIARVMNLTYSGFNFVAMRLVQQYNGKPFLARTTTTFYHEPGKYFAVDIDAHRFGFPARKGLNLIKYTLNKVIFDTAFVIEGHNDAELPEQILCCARISKIGVEQTIEFPKELALKYHIYDKPTNSNPENDPDYDINKNNPNFDPSLEPSLNPENNTENNTENNQGW